MTTRVSITRNSARTSALLATALLLGSAVVAGAQGTATATVDGRWAPWIGCWQPSARDVDAASISAGNQTPAPVVCVVPATSGGVDLVTVTGSEVATTERVDANGQRRAVSREGCDGWETAEFSPNGKRIYLKSEHTCSGNRTRVSTGIMSISPNGEWLDVQGVRVDAHTGVRIVHYGHVAAPSVLSDEMKTALAGRSLATSTAVLAVSDSLRIADVVEATKHADPLVVQTWLAERGQGFDMDAKRLMQVADAGVPSNVVDVMVALSYPRAFAINLAESNGQIVPTEQTRAIANANESLRDGPTVYMNWDPLYSSSCSAYGYGYGYANRYGYSNLYGSGCGYSRYYPGYGYYTGVPIIITRPSGSVDVPAAPDTRGRMVKGSGYTRRGSGSSDGGQPRSSTSGGSSSSGSTGGSSTSSGSSGGSSGTSEPRTAKPRSP